MGLLNAQLLLILIRIGMKLRLGMESIVNGYLIANSNSARRTFQATYLRELNSQLKNR